MRGLVASTLVAGVATAPFFVTMNQNLPSQNTFYEVSSSTFSFTTTSPQKVESYMFFYDEDQMFGPIDDSSYASTAMDLDDIPEFPELKSYSVKAKINRVEKGDYIPPDEEDFLFLVDLEDI